MGLSNDLLVPPFPYPEAQQMAVLNVGDNAFEDVVVVPLSMLSMVSCTVGSMLRIQKKQVARNLITRQYHEGTPALSPTNPCLRQGNG